jgi:hypothetical protein
MNARLISSVGERAQRDPVKVMGQAVNARSHACEFMQTFFHVIHVTAGKEGVKIRMLVTTARWNGRPTPDEI